MWFAWTMKCDPFAIEINSKWTRLNAGTALEYIALPELIFAAGAFHLFWQRFIFIYNWVLVMLDKSCSLHNAWDTQDKIINAEKSARVLASLFFFYSLKLRSVFPLLSYVKQHLSTLRNTCCAHVNNETERSMPYSAQPSGCSA